MDEHGRRPTGDLKSLLDGASHESLRKALLLYWSVLLRKIPAFFGDLKEELRRAEGFGFTLRDWEYLEPNGGSRDSPIVLSQILLERLIAKDHPSSSSHVKSEIRIFLETLCSVPGNDEPDLSMHIADTAADTCTLEKNFDALRGFRFRSLTRQELDDLHDMDHLQRAPMSENARKMRFRLQELYRNGRFGIDGASGSDYALLPAECVADGNEYIPLSLMLLEGSQAKNYMDDQRVTRLEETSSTAASGGVGGGGQARLGSNEGHVDLKHIFNRTGKGGVECLRYLFLGPPGSGKTMTSCEVLRQWAKGHLLRECKLALYIPARALSEDVQDVWDLLQLSKPCYGLNDSEMADVRIFVKENPKQVLLVIDGLDEVPKELISGDSHFSRLLRGNPLASCRIIATSRPCKQALVLLRSVDVRYQLCELTEDQQRAMRQDRLSAGDCAEFEKQLENKPQIRPLLGNPLQATLIISMFRGEAGHLQRLPSGLCDVYGDVITRALQRYVTRNLKLSDCDLSDSVDMAVKHKCVEDSRVSGVAKVLEEVEKLALDGLVNQQYLFPVSKVATEALESGLLVHWSVTDDTRPARVGLSCQFIHLTIQEFLAARCIARHEDLKKSVDEAIETIGVDARRFNFWLCLAGMLDKDHLVYLLSRMRVAAVNGTFEQQKVAMRLILHALAEVLIQRQERIPSSWRIQDFSKQSALLEVRLSEVMGERVSLNFSQHLLGDADFNVLCLVLRSDRTVRDLNLESCNLDERRCAELSKCAGLKKVERLDVGVNRDISGPGLRFVLAPFSAACSNNLTSLSIRGCNLSENDLPTLCDFLKSTRTLNSVSLGRTMPTLSSEGCHLLAAALKVNRSLTKLCCSSMHITDEGATALADAAAAQGRISCLNLRENCIGDAGGRAWLVAAAQLGCRLTDLSFNQLTDNILQELIHTLRSVQAPSRSEANQASFVLRLAGNDISQFAAEMLPAMVHSEVVIVDFGFAFVTHLGLQEISPDTFQESRFHQHGSYSQLDLTFLGMGDKSLCQIQDYLASLKSAASLSMGHNRLSAAGMHPLATSLKTNRWIQALDLSYNNIGVAGLETILDVIDEDGENSTLRYLSVMNNPLVEADSDESLWQRLEVALSRLVSECPHLELVGLAATGIGDRGAAAIGDFLPAESSLMWLSLSANAITVVGIESLRRGLTRNSTLCTLTVANNQLDESGVALLNAIQEERACDGGVPMETISISGNPFPSEMRLGPGLLNGRLFFRHSTTILSYLDGCKVLAEE